MDRRRYRRVGLCAVLLAAVAPYRVYGSFPLVESVSVLDAALLLAALGMVARHAVVGPTPGPDRRLVGLLAVLPALSVASLLWTDDLAATGRECLSYAEALLAFWYAVQQTRGVPAEVLVTWLRRLTYVLLVPPFLMLAHVPGFGPQEPGLKHSSGNYLSYFSRLSHPFLGRSNNLATVLLLLVVVLVYWAVTRHDRRTYVAAVVAVVAIGLTGSRGALLALLAVAAVHLVLRDRARRVANRRLLATVLGTAVVVAAAGWAFYLLNPDTRLYISGRLSLSNVLLRESRLTDGFARLGDHPWLGYGAGTLPGNDLGLAGGVHNTFLQQLLAYGVVLGLVGALALVELTRYFLGGRSSGLRRAIGLTLVAALVDFTVESSFEGTVLRVVFYLLLGVLVGLLHAIEGPRLEAVAARAARQRVPVG
jgi:O-antigen ligase